MDENYDKSSESNWRIPIDNNNDDGHEHEQGEETLASPSEYQKFFDCNSDTCKRSRKPRQHKVNTSIETLIKNMDSANNFRETLSEITMMTHNILNSLKLCIDNRNLKHSESEKNTCSCGYYSREKHLERITILAEKFLKTFVEPYEETTDQSFRTYEQYNDHNPRNYEKYPYGDSLELDGIPLVMPFKQFELIVPVKVSKGRVINAFQHVSENPAESTIKDTHKTFIPNLMSLKLSESSSDVFLSLKDTSYFSCDDTDPLVESGPLGSTFNCKEFHINATQSQYPFSPKLSKKDASKCKSSSHLQTPKAISLCLTCGRPINYCTCGKPSLTKMPAEKADGGQNIPTKLLRETYQTHMAAVPKETQKMMTDVSKDFQTIRGTEPPPICKCKKCGAADCICETSAAVASITRIRSAKSTLCNKCGKEKCICKAAQMPYQMCSRCVQPIEKCICEQPQTSKTYMSNLPEVRIKFCKWCGKALDKCICEQPQTSKYIDSSNKLTKSSLNAHILDKPSEKICTVCGNDLSKCICTKTQTSKAVTSQSKLLSETSSKKLQTLANSTVCQCGFKSVECKCQKLNPTELCNKCGLPTSKCICPKKMPQIYCYTCHRTVDMCICKVASETLDTPKICGTCGNTLERCVCSKYKPPKVISCNRCGELFHKCKCKKTQVTQTEIFKTKCEKCDEQYCKCTFSTDKSVQTLNEEICTECGQELSACCCKKTQATQTDTPEYQRILCNECKSKTYVKKGEEPIPCTCGMDHVRSERELTDLLAISEKDLDDDIVKCICDLTEALRLSASAEETPQETIVVADVVEKLTPKEPFSIVESVISISAEETPQETIVVADVVEKRTPKEPLSIVESVISNEEVIETPSSGAPEPPPKPPRKVYRLAFPQHKDLEICKRCRFEPSPLIDEDGRVFCPGNCGCCLCPWTPHLRPSREDALKHLKFKVCKCRKRGTVFTKFTVTDSDCSQVSYFDECPCREIAEAKHFQLYGFDMWDVNEKLLQKFRGEEVYLRDVREVIPTKIPSTKFFSSKLYLEEFKDANHNNIHNEDT